MSLNAVARPRVLHQRRPDNLHGAFSRRCVTRNANQRSTACQRGWIASQFVGGEDRHSGVTRLRFQQAMLKEIGYLLYEMLARWRNGQRFPRACATPVARPGSDDGHQGASP